MIFINRQSIRLSLVVFLPGLLFFTSFQGFADPAADCLLAKTKKIIQPPVLVDEPQVRNNPVIKFVSTPDTDIFTRTVGDSDKVVIAISGGPGVSSDYMAQLDPLTTKGFKGVSFDQRGTGKTRSKKKNIDYSLDRYVADIEAVRKSSGAEKVTLFGHSFGALPVMSYAITYPERVSALIFFGPMAPKQSIMDIAGAHFAKRLSKLQKRKIISEEIPDPAVDANGYLSAITPAYFFDPNYKGSQSLENTQLSFNANAGTYASLAHFDLTAELANMKMPVLVMYGAADPFGKEMPSSVVNAFKSADLTFKQIQHCGYFWEECQTEFNQIVEKFKSQNKL